MSYCNFTPCQETAEGTCQNCRQTFCAKHLSKGSFKGPGSDRQVYGTYCLSCMQDLEMNRAFKAGSRWKLGAAIQMYILSGIIFVAIVVIFLLFFA